MDVTLPNGQVIQGVPDGTTKAQLAAKLQANGMTVPQEWLAPLGSTQNPTAQQKLPQADMLDPTGINTAIGNTAISAINAPIKGIAGIAGLVKGALTPGETAGNIASDFMDAVTLPQLKTDTLNKQAASQAANAVINIPSNVAAKYSDIANKMQQTVYNANPANKNKPGDYGAQDNASRQLLTNLAANIGPMAGGIRSAKPTAALEPTPFKIANDAGYAIMPSEAAIKGGKAPIGKVVEGLAGSAKTGVDATVKNQAVTNRLAAQEIGAPKDVPLSPNVLDNLRKPYNAVYDQVSKLGTIYTDKAFLNDLNDVGRTPGNSFPMANDPDIQALKNTYAVKKFDAADAVLQIRNLRRNASANIKAGSANLVKNAPMLDELGHAQLQVADALENQLERFAGSPADKVGNPKLIQDWRNARQSLAKINSVDNAIKEGTTDVSAPALAKQMNRGAPLSGNLRTIADTANAFPISVRDIGQVRNKVPINALEGLMGTGGIGAAMFGEPHAAMTLGAGMIARPLARAGLLSKTVQSGMLPKPSSLAFKAAPATGIGALLAGQLSPDDYTRLLLTGGK